MRLSEKGEKAKIERSNDEKLGGKLGGEVEGMLSCKTPQE